MTKMLERVEPKAVLHHCRELGLEPKTVSACLGVHAKTLQRWKDGSAQPGEGVWRMLEKLETICQTSLRLLKPGAGKTWFQTPNATLGGERPIELLRRGEIDQVRNVLGMLEWGIY
jgi:uncharacterized protein (DUF2384 family)